MEGGTQGGREGHREGGREWVGLTLSGLSSPTG